MLPAPPEPTFEEALEMRPDDDLDETIVDGVVVGEVSDVSLKLREVRRRPPGGFVAIVQTGMVRFFPVASATSR